jgi:hypothetical protein
MRSGLAQELVSCTVISSGVQTSGIRPRSATSPAKRRRTTQLLSDRPTATARIRDQSGSSSTSSHIRRGIYITSRFSFTDVSHAEMNESVGDTYLFTRLHDLPRPDIRANHESPNRQNHCGVKSGARCGINRHELLVNDLSREGNSSCHGRNNRTTHRLLKINCSTPRAIGAGRFNVRKRHRGIDRWHQTTRSHEKSKKNHQTA